MMGVNAKTEDFFVADETAFGSLDNRLRKIKMEYRKCPKTGLIGIQTLEKCPVFKQLSENRNFFQISDNL